MDTQTVLLAVLSSAGVFGVLTTLIRGIGGWVNGSAGRERSKNTDLESQRAAAVLERETARRDAAAAASKQRRTAEYASQLRRQLFEAGITPNPWPVELVDDPGTPTPEGNTP